MSERMSREALLVTHTGRRRNIEPARTVTRDLIEAGFTVRVLAEEAGPPDKAAPPRDLGVVVGTDARKPGERATTTPRSRGLGDEDNKEHP